MGRTRGFGLLVWLFASALAMVHARSAEEVDSDGDGMSDVREQMLLERFVPRFQVSRIDCAVRPALFEQGIVKPTVVERDGTIYGQVTPRAGVKGGDAEVEIHFYDLWSKDCGRMGHPLDAAMHGAVWVGSTAWPLVTKMQSDFLAAAIATVEQGRGVPIEMNGAHGSVKSTIYVANTVASGVGTGGANTGNALNTAGMNTGAALDEADTKTESTLSKSAKVTGEALKKSTKAVGRLLHLAEMGGSWMRLHSEE